MRCRRGSWEGAVLAALVASSPAGAGELPARSGVEIVRLVNARDEGEHVVSRLHMELVDRDGRKRERDTVGYRKYFGKEKRSVLFFVSPKSVKGTAFLTFDYAEPERDDAQWLYLPALRKVRRIASRDRGGYFLGTDFSYEDIKKESKFALEDYRHELRAEEVVEGVLCYVVEQTPVSDAVARELDIGRAVSAIDPTVWMPRRTEFWDRKGKRLRTVRTREIRQVDGIWTAHRIEAENHQTGHRTVFTLQSVDYATPVPDDVFTQGFLRKGP